ncbi:MULTISPECIES: cell division ATP-binding protein FtsE [Dialister]|jgi:cell division transport system ATP-binding protein|nr:MULTISPECIES: cell division ATP-binding protein FtsE [Dialister]MEE1348734.1 cell division ATP-binding protein FtsE [Dialister hominis]HJI42850.1 cell division ATP-binding protein FtsE [Veillonellaceae bacterium]MBS6412831.1 cell division ATP-binding protein FtsE [Dialister sp.]MCH3912413.1 cell division ATP-binding protein FtsE [Dialister sp.]MCH3929829.1 cell division ATP-binding protein FtsE [Dialister sp.]
MITFDHVSLNYDARHTALSNINIHIDKGEFVFIVGPSGAGKSTFVKILTHELVPETGSVIVNNIKINKLKPSKVPYYRRSLGIVFQDFRLLSEKTVFENIAFVLRVTGAKSKDIKERVNKVLDLVGLRGKEKELPSKLSGGEQQRVAIARALVNQPTLLIADEPTGNLDPKTSEEIMKLFTEINHMGTTIIMVTHNKDLVNAMHKRVVNIEEGHIVNDVKKGGYDLNV